MSPAQGWYKFVKHSIFLWIYLQSRNNVLDVENKPTVTGGKGSGGEINWEIGIDIDTLLYV